MEYYVGLDVSLKQTSICVVDQTGSVVREGVVDLDPEVISVCVRSKAPDAVRIGLETGPTSTWLWTGTMAMVSSPDFLRASERPTAISTLNRQRHLTPSCGGFTPTAERTVGPARMIVGELDTQTRN